MAFFPPRLLQIALTTAEPLTNWYSDDPLDCWNGAPYQWKVTFAVNSQSHSSPYTPTQFSYTGMDVIVGDWIGTLGNGQSVKIIHINSKDMNSVDANVEDVDRFNTFTDATMQGSGLTADDGYLFQLGDDGLPILAPMSPFSANLASNLAWQLDQISRFRYRNLINSYYRVDQPGHTFVLGDVIYLLSNGTYAKVNPANTSIVSAVGTVSDIGTPGVDWFAYRPVGRVVQNLSPPLPGQPGQLIYLSSGGLTTTQPNSYIKPVYIQLEINTSAIVLDRNVDATAGRGYVSQTYIVPNTTSIPATANAGDQVFVNNTGQGEWNHNIFDTPTTTKTLVTQDASHVDAETLETNISLSTVSPVTLGQISQNRCVTVVSVTVNTAFNATSTITVGTIANPTAFMSMAQIDLTATGTYTSNPNVICAAPETIVIVTVSIASGDTGMATINLTYT